MKFSTSPVKKVVARMANASEIVSMQESINNSWMNLNNIQKEDVEIQQIVDNVNFSLNAIAKYGDSAIKILNADGSLEKLLGIPEKLITVEKAQEGLSEAAKTAWEKFKEGVKKVIEWIKNLVNTICDRFAELYKRFPIYKANYKADYQKGQEAYKKAFIESTITKGHTVFLQGIIDGPLRNVDKLVNDLCLYANDLHGENATGKKAGDYYDKFANSNIFDDLENGRFFLRSEGDPEKDTWAKCGYTDPDQIFSEIDKTHNLVRIIGRLKTECIANLEKALEYAHMDGDDDSAAVQEMREVVAWAKKVMWFATVLMRIDESTLSAVGITMNDLKTKFNLKDKQS